MFFKYKDKKLGVSFGTRTYDLPLDTDAGTGFLKLLIILMSIMAVLAFAARFALSDLTDRWSSGLENKVTIEFPAQDIDGNVTERSALKDQMAKAQLFLKNQPSVQNIIIMSDDDIQQLVSPWLGEDMNLSDFPLPGLMAITLTDRASFNVLNIERELKAISPLARVDTHQGWLENILQFTGALQFAAFLLIAIVLFITIVAVAGAVRARIAVHKEEVELLHLIGASDTYIIKQFQRHTFLLSLGATIGGLLLGLAAIALIGWISGEMDITLIPEFSLKIHQIALLFLLPPIISILAAATARFTVLHALTRMP